MAEFDDLKKIAAEQRDIEKERLELEKKQFEETAEDRKSRIDKKAFQDLVKEFRKNNNIEKEAANLNEKRLEKLVKGPMAKLVKSSSKNAELQTAHLNLTKEQQARATAIAAEQNRVQKEEQSILRRTGRVLATFTTRFLETSETGQILLGKGLEASLGGNSIIGKGINKLVESSVDGQGEFKSELEKLREQLGERLARVRQGISNVKKGFVATLQFLTDPTKMVKGIGLAVWKFAIKPVLGLLFKGLFALLKLPFKAFDKIVGFFRGRGSPDRLRQTEAEREQKRDDKRQSGLLAKLGAIKEGIMGRRGGLFGLLRSLLPLILAAAPFIIAGIALFAGLKGGIAEFLKTGDIQKAIGEGFVGIAKVLTVGLIDTDELREKIKKPFLGLVTGITDVIDEGFSAKNIQRTLVGAGGLAASPFDLAFKLGTNIVEGVSRLFGAEEFADKVEATFKDFKLFDGIVDGINKVTDSMVDFFTGQLNQAATSIANIDPTVQAAKIARQTNIENLNKALKALGEAEVQLNFQLGQLTDPEERAKVQEQLAKVVANKKATRQRIQELQGAEIADDKTIAAQVERSKKAKAEQIETLSKEADQDEKKAAKVKKSFTERAFESAQAAQAAVGELFATGAQALSNAIANPDIASGKNLDALLTENTTLRDRAGRSVNITPITANTVTAPQPPTPLVVPMATRNNENTLQRNRERDHRAAVT